MHPGPFFHWHYTYVWIFADFSKSRILQSTVDLWNELVLYEKTIKQQFLSNNMCLLANLRNWKFRSLSLYDYGLAQPINPLTATGNEWCCATGYIGLIWLLEERVHITCILFLAIIYKSICQKCRNFLDVLHIYSQHKFLQLSAICNNRKTENRPLSNYAYRYNRFRHNNDCLNSNAKHNYRNDLTVK